MMNQINRQSEAERMRQLLLEDGESDADVVLADALASWEAPRPTAMQTRLLVDQLADFLPQPRFDVRRWLWLLMLSQLRVVRFEIWLASLLVMALGVLVTLAVETPNQATLPFTIIAPLVAAVGIGVLYDEEQDALRELEFSTRASGPLLLWLRLTLVFGFDLIVALVGSVVLAATRTELSLWPLVTTWLAPMTFLSGLAFVLSILSHHMLIGAATSIALWAFHLIAIQIPKDGRLLLELVSMPGFSQVENRWLLIVAGVAMAIMGLWVITVDEPSENQF